jgi:hypothetical protein
MAPSSFGTVAEWQVLSPKEARDRTTAYRGSARLARRARVLLGLAVGRLVVGRQNT